MSISRATRNPTFSLVRRPQFNRASFDYKEESCYPIEQPDHEVTRVGDANKKEVEIRYRVRPAGTHGELDLRATCVHPAS